MKSLNLSTATARISWLGDSLNKNATTGVER